MVSLGTFLGVSQPQQQYVWYYVLVIGAKPRFSAFYGQGSGPVFLSNLNCTRSELKILDCRNDYYAAQTCGHYKDAGVQCLGRRYLQPFV